MSAWHLADMLECADECPLLGAKRTLTNAAYRSPFMSTRPKSSRYAAITPSPLEAVAKRPRLRVGAIDFAKMLARCRAEEERRARGGRKGGELLGTSLDRGLNQMLSPPMSPSERPRLRVWRWRWQRWW